jgi:hypothetical protein
MPVAGMPRVTFDWLADRLTKAAVAFPETDGEGYGSKNVSKQRPICVLVLSKLSFPSQPKIRVHSFISLRLRN